MHPVWSMSVCGKRENQMEMLVRGFRESTDQLTGSAS